MKNIFLTTSLLAFLFTSAQQNEIFDLQKHLQEKSEKDGKVKQEKELLLLHQNWLHLPSQVEEKMPFLAKLSYTLPNGNNVYILPQDNMPCVVPNMNHYSMPNVSIQKDFAIKIPNAVTPYKIIPDLEKNPYQIFLEKKSGPK